MKRRSFLRVLSTLADLPLAFKVIRRLPPPLRVDSAFSSTRAQGCGPQEARAERSSAP